MFYEDSLYIWITLSSIYPCTLACIISFLIGYDWDLLTFRELGETVLMVDGGDNLGD